VPGVGRESKSEGERWRKGSLRAESEGGEPRGTEEDHLCGSTDRAKKLRSLRTKEKGVSRRKLNYKKEIIETLWYWRNDKLLATTE
jgi:hypothetical protein